MPTMQVWRKRAFAGLLNDVQNAFFARTKPAEELYDLESDPYETKNLAGSPEFEPLLAEHRAALEQWMRDTHDLGDVPEQELIDRGLVKDLLNFEYRERIEKHPNMSPVP